MPTRAVARCACALLVLSACKLTAPDRSTETFSGTLQPGATAVHNFTVVAQGAVDVTLTSLFPQATIAVGLALGEGDSTSCDNSLFVTQSAKVGYLASGDLVAGAYCVALYDVGNLTAPNTYALTVVHP